MERLAFEDEDDGYDLPRAHGRGGRLAGLFNLIGAVASVALVIGAGVWAYNLAVRDVSGVPVIRALSGPMRIAPENPGGEVAAHQGLAVNAVAAEGTASAAPDTLVLAPKPEELTEEDASAEDLGTADPVAPKAALAPVIAPEVPADPAAAPAADAEAVARALAEALAEDADSAPLEAAPEAGLAPAVAAAPDEADPAMEGAPPAGSVIRPKARPAALAAGAAPAQPAAAEVDVAAIPVGTRLVQLGAFDTEEQARGEWTRLVGLFGPVFDGKALVVQSAVSGGRTFYRLRAHGFADEAEARAFCLTLLEKNTSCIPAEQR